MTRLLLAGWFVQALPASPARSAGSASLWTTAQGDTERMAKQADVLFVADFPFDGPTIGISGKRGQKIVGFGSAFTEAAATTFAQLPADKQDGLLQMLFGADGMGFTAGRVHINSCDFSIGNYDFDSVDGDVELDNFDTEVTHDQEFLIPLIARARELVKARGEELSLLASPWSPPAWMKSSGEMDGSPDVCLKDGLRPTWAKYMSKWISAYEAQGVPIWAVTVQNEPGFAAPWEACKWSKDEEAEFVAKDLGPTLRSEHPDVKIFAYDHNKDHSVEWAETILGDTSAAAEFVDGVALHWYSGDMFAEVATIHWEFPDAIILGSEATYEKGAWDAGSTMMREGKWSFGEGYAHDIMGDLNAGASGWIDWNMLLDKDGGPNHVGNVCDAAVISDGQEFYVHPQLLFMGHFSKWVPPGSEYIETRVSNSVVFTGETRGYGTCTSEDGLQAASFMRPDQAVALVVLNCGDDAIEFKISAGEKAARSAIPAHAIQTYLIGAGGAGGDASPEAREGTREGTRTGTNTTALSKGAARRQQRGTGADRHCRHFSSGEGAEACPSGSEMVTEAECRKAGPLNDPFHTTSDTDPAGCFAYRGHFYWNDGSGAGREKRRLRCKACAEADLAIWGLFSDPPPGPATAGLAAGGGRAVLLAAALSAAAVALWRRHSRARGREAAASAPLQQAAALPYAPLV